MYNFNYIHLHTDSMSYYYDKKNCRVLVTDKTSNLDKKSIFYIGFTSALISYSYRRFNGINITDIYNSLEIKISIYVFLIIIGLCVSYLVTNRQNKIKVERSEFEEVSYEKACNLFSDQIYLFHKNRVKTILLMIFINMCSLYLFIYNMYPYFAIIAVIVTSAVFFMYFGYMRKVEHLYKRFKKGELVINNKKEEKISSDEISSDIFNKIQ